MVRPGSKRGASGEKHPDQEKRGKKKQKDLNFGIRKRGNTSN